jgi:DNA-binding GntR family transcriptional regulator
VVPASLEEYLAWLEVREALEGMAARLAARQVTEAGLAKMREILGPFQSSTVPGTTDAYARANAAFHAALISESGNPVLRRIWQLYDHMQMVRFRVIDRLGRMRQSLEEHLAIIRALERRDPRGAEQLARRHVRLLREAALRRLKTLEPESPG